MVSSTAGGAANGLNILGGVAGIAGSLITSQQGKQDKRVSGGQEDPAIAALRRRLAAQNAQTAMSVAASQQGVNPALAQRNAQQALSQQQVQTNANLAQGNLQSTLASRAATRGQQHQQIAGTAMGIGTGLIGMGTSLGAQSAYDAAGTPAEGVGESAAGLTSAPAPGRQAQEGAAGLGSPLAMQGAAGLSAPPQSMVAPVPSAPPVSPAPVLAQGGSPLGQMQMRGGAPQVMGGPAPAAPQAMPKTSPLDAAFQATLPNSNGYSTQPAGQMQMRGDSPQAMGSAPALQAAPQQAMQTSQMQEVSVAQPAPAVAPPPAQVALTSSQQMQMLDPAVYDDPINSGMAQMVSDMEARGNDDVAEAIRRALLQRTGNL